MDTGQTSTKYVNLGFFLLNSHLNLHVMKLQTFCHEILMNKRYVRNKKQNTAFNIKCEKLKAIFPKSGQEQ